MILSFSFTSMEKAMPPRHDYQSSPWSAVPDINEYEQQGQGSVANPVLSTTIIAPIPTPKPTRTLMSSTDSNQNSIISNKQSDLCSIKEFPMPSIESGLPWVHDAFVIDAVISKQGEAERHAPAPHAFILAHLHCPCILCRKDKETNQHNSTCNEYKRASTRRELNTWMSTGGVACDSSYVSSLNSPEEQSLFRSGCTSPAFECHWHDGSKTKPVAAPQWLLETNLKGVAYFHCPIPERLAHLAWNHDHFARLVLTIRPSGSAESEMMENPSIRVPLCARLPVNGGMNFVSHASISNDSDFSSTHMKAATDLRASDFGGLVVPKSEKRHKLIACVWAKGSYQNRQSKTVSDVLSRLPEWLEYHTMVGFDHFYIYDNSDEGDDRMLDLLHPYIKTLKIVTHVRWPASLCRREHRSSQIAAANSCIRRFGRYSDWTVHFDVDDYLVPRLGKITDGSHVTHAPKKHWALPTLLSILEPYSGEKNSIGSVAWPMAYCAPCHASSPNRRPVPADMPFLGRCQCCGKSAEYKPKVAIKADRVLSIYIHYPVAGMGGSDKSPSIQVGRVRTHVLSAATEARYMHIRSNFSFDDHKSSLTFPGPNAHARNVKGHKNACASDGDNNNRALLHCWLSEMDESFSGGGIRGSFRIWLRQQNRGAEFTAPLYGAMRQREIATASALVTVGTTETEAPVKRLRHIPNARRVFESYEEVKLKKQKSRASRKKARKDKDDDEKKEEDDDDSVVHHETELKDLFV